MQFYFLPNDNSIVTISGLGGNVWPKPSTLLAGSNGMDPRKEALSEFHPIPIQALLDRQRGCTYTRKSVIQIFDRSGNRSPIDREEPPTLHSTREVHGVVERNGTKRSIAIHPKPKFASSNGLGWIAYTCCVTTKVSRGWGIQGLVKGGM